MLVGAVGTADAGDGFLPQDPATATFSRRAVDE
jgi:hypothetical protein